MSEEPITTDLGTDELAKAVTTGSPRASAPLKSAPHIGNFPSAINAERKNDVTDYVIGFYNSIRLRSKLGNLSPKAFERESTSKNLANFLKLLSHYKTTSPLHKLMRDA